MLFLPPSNITLLCTTYYCRPYIYFIWSIYIRASKKNRGDWSRNGAISVLTVWNSERAARCRGAGRRWETTKYRAWLIVALLVLPKSGSGPVKPVTEPLKNRTKPDCRLAGSDQSDPWFGRFRPLFGNTYFAYAVWSPLHQFSWYFWSGLLSTGLCSYSEVKFQDMEPKRGHCDLVALAQPHSLSRDAVSKKLLLTHYEDNKASYQSSMLWKCFKVIPEVENRSSGVSQPTVPIRETDHSSDWAEPNHGFRLMKVA